MHPQSVENEKCRSSTLLLNRYLSQNKLSSLKQEIMRIPKVKQILQKDRFVYSQDIEKRLQLIGTIKNENCTGVSTLQNLRKDVIKRTKRHKTNFKIPLTRKNVQSLTNLIKGHIDQNQKYKNAQIVFLKDYVPPFDLSKLSFMDELNPVKIKYKEKFPEFQEGVLQKNKLFLQHVILNRNIKREINLDKKKKK